MTKSAVWFLLEVTWRFRIVSKFLTHIIHCHPKKTRKRRWVGEEYRRTDITLMLENGIKCNRPLNYINDIQLVADYEEQQPHSCACFHLIRYVYDTSTGNKQQLHTLLTGTLPNINRPNKAYFLGIILSINCVSKTQEMQLCDTHSVSCIYKWMVEQNNIITAPKEGRKSYYVITRLA